MTESAREARLQGLATEWRTMTYQVTSASTTTEGDVVVPGTTENKTFTRRVEFVKE